MRISSGLKKDLLVYGAFVAVVVLVAAVFALSGEQGVRLLQIVTQKLGN